MLDVSAILASLVAYSFTRTDETQQPSPTSLSRTARRKAARGRPFQLPNGRRIGYAECGDPSGAVVLWFHGTPGARRQFPLLGRRAANKLGLRVVVVERPGSGLSDPHPYAAVAD